MTDPAVQAVADALRQSSNDDYGTDGTYEGDAQVAVDAYRRHVLASRPDAERLTRIITWVEGSGFNHLSQGESRWLIAALADATAARQAAEADRDRIADERTDHP